jgi:hypothetical protein
MAGLIDDKNWNIGRDFIKHLCCQLQMGLSRSAQYLPHMVSS